MEIKLLDSIDYKKHYEILLSKDDREYILSGYPKVDSLVGQCMDDGVYFHFFQGNPLLETFGKQFRTMPDNLGYFMNTGRILHPSFFDKYPINEKGSQEKLNGIADRLLEGVYIYQANRVPIDFRGTHIGYVSMGLLEEGGSQYTLDKEKSVLV